MKIWIVENKKELEEEEYARILTEAGHTVQTFTNGGDVLRVFLHEYPDGILINDQLGDWEGNTIVAVAQGQRVRYVALMSDLPECKVPVADGVTFFQKPISATDLSNFFAQKQGNGGVK